MRFSESYANTRKYNKAKGKRFDGKVAVVTGGEDGIGKEVAIYLAKTGFKIILGVKDLEANEQNVERMKRETKSDEILAIKLDLSSVESVREFGAKVSAQESSVDLVINSYEIFEKQTVVTKDGIDSHFAENYLGHFLLTHVLMKSLRKSPNARIVNVTSILHTLGTINFSDKNMNKSHLPLLSFAQSKLAQVLFTQELGRRLSGDTNITTYAVSPEVFRHEMHSTNNYLWNYIMAKLSNPDTGAQTVLYVALDDELKAESGYYYTDLKKVETLLDKAKDETTAKKLWKWSEDLVKLEDDLKLKEKEVIPANTANTEVTPSKPKVKPTK